MYYVICCIGRRVRGWWALWGEGGGGRGVIPCVLCNMLYQQTDTVSYALFKVGRWWLVRLGFICIMQYIIFGDVYGENW